MNITLAVSLVLAMPVAWPPVLWVPKMLPVKQDAAKQDDPAVVSTPEGEAKDADELLSRLEKADKDIRTLTASIRYETISTIDNDKQSRMGKVSFLTRPTAPGEPVDRAINVTFDTVFRDGKRFVEGKSFILNDGVFVEHVEKDKQINRYRLGPEGRKIDPLKIGEGPFPLPFGQKPEDIKSRFEVTMLPGTDGVVVKDEGVRKYFEGTYQLKLIPKAGEKAKSDFSEARIWFQKSDLIPVQARTVKPSNGGVDEFFLFEPNLNQPIDPAVFDTRTPAGWQEEQKDLK